MKYSKTCPKCLSENIVRFDGIPCTPTSSNLLFVKRSLRQGTVIIRRYVCCNCGFTEEWIDNEDLKEVADSKFAKR